MSLYQTLANESTYFLEFLPLSAGPIREPNLNWLPCIKPLSICVFHNFLSTPWQLCCNANLLLKKVILKGAREPLLNDALHACYGLRKERVC